MTDDTATGEPMRDAFDGLPEHPADLLADRPRWADDQEALAPPAWARIPGDGICKLAKDIRAAFAHAERLRRAADAGDASPARADRAALHAVHLCQAFWTVTGRDRDAPLAMAAQDPFEAMETARRAINPDHGLGGELDAQIDRYERWAQAGGGFTLDAYFRATAELERLRADATATALADRRALALAFVYETGTDDDGRPWSMASLGERTGIHKSTVQGLIRRGRELQDRTGIARPGAER